MIVFSFTWFHAGMFIDRDKDDGFKSMNFPMQRYSVGDQSVSLLLGAARAYHRTARMLSQLLNAFLPL